MTRHQIGLVCSGGGARGAWEAGIIRYLREELPAQTRPHVRFDILAGTSVGAMTCCFLAATMDSPAEQGRGLAALWTSLSLEEVFRVAGESAWSVGRKMWKATRANENPDGWRLYDLLHPEPLEQLVHQRIAWPRIAANLAKGHFQALAVSTTRIRDGRTQVFVQRREPGLPEWSRDPWTVATEVVLSPEHALASAAIPLLFRSVKVGDEFYCDGFVRQNTPVSPALRLGADRLLILSLGHKPRVAVEPPKLKALPSTPQVIGKVLNALMLDRLDHDLDRLRRINALVEKGRQLGGDAFVEQLNQAVSSTRGSPYRFVRELVVRPSRDLADLARPHLEARAKKESTDALPTRLLHRLAGSQLFSQAELGSYLLFDAPYARDLIELGMHDAHERREQLLAFFAPD
ncbi:MAG: patatin-like phospholipase family protein [Myxococcaceae bacterium]|jgi:NTE family protein|nr:patatin-like phospholipase family protein [Myxococcaceae bacterium]